MTADELDTPLTEVRSETLVVRGIPVEHIVRDFSYLELVQHLLGLDLPPGGDDVLRACLVVNSDHGLASNATTAAVAAAATNRSGVPAGVAAGLLAIGEASISPRSGMVFLAEGVAAWRASGVSVDDAADEQVARLRAASRRVPGYGSPFHSNGDPRVPPLRECAEQAGTWGDHAELFTALGDALARTGRPLPPNEVGLVGALLADLGLTPDQGEAVSVLATVPSLVANVVAELDGPPRFVVAASFRGWDQEDRA